MITQLEVRRIRCSYKPVGLRRQREQWGVSAQTAGCEACIPSHKAGSLTSPESRKSQVDCNLPDNLDDINKQSLG